MNIPKNPLFVLAGNGPYANRGCEAIIRGTVEILRKYFKNPRFVVVSHFHSHNQFNDQCRRETDPSITHLATTIVKRYNLAWWLRQLNRLLHSETIAHSPYKNMEKSVKDALAVLSVGGDNYSLYYSLPDSYLVLDDFVMKRNRPIVIWGASVGPFDQNPEFEAKIIPHLRMVNGIFSRESITTEYLSKKDVTDNVYNVADPAIMMKPVIPALNKIPFEIPEDSIGINLSHLLAKYVCNGNLDKWGTIASDVIASILNNVNGQIILIPHVMGLHSNDYEFLNKIKKSIKKRNERLYILPPNLTAAETKWVIAKMKVFAGARTHSTIASLSSCIPTLSFAYSIKAFGINRQFYGHTKYCINPYEINADNVMSAIIDLIKNNSEVRLNLQETIPKVQEMAMNAGLFLTKILADFDE